ncbi:unnamed protein product, partial [Musa textilis]
GNLWSDTRACCVIYSTAPMRTDRERRRRQPKQNLRCPRCESTNTKFCYYNNYNLSQPRHFCKNCRRYWTKGGALRNIPIGGSTRKNSKRFNASSSSSAGCSIKRSNPPTPLPHLPDLPKPEPFSVLYPPLDPDRHLLDMTGSFSSLLSSDAHLESFLGSIHPAGGGCATSLPSSSSVTRCGVRVQGTESQSPTGDMSTPPVENVERLETDSECWSAGWTDLAIYNPGSSMQ